MFALSGLVPDHIQIFKLDGSLFFNDKSRWPTNGTDPVGNLIGVTHCRRQTNKLDLARKVNDHFLPYWTAKSVLNEVHLIKYNHRQVIQRP